MIRRLTGTDREIVRLALPAAGALAADPLLSLVDTALVGNLGAVPLAALGINLAVFTTMFVSFNFLVYGTTAEVAQHRGRGDQEAVARHTVQAAWLAVGVGLLLVVAIQAGAPLVLDLMGATGSVREPALSYLRIRGFSAVAVLLVMVGHGMFRGLKDTRTPLVVAVAVNLCNAGLSAVLVYPVGLGVAGAAWGTLVAQVGAATTFVVLARRALGSPSLRLDRTAMSSIVGISRDLFLRTLSLLSGLLVTTAIASRMGVRVVAGHQVVREVWSLLALTLDGLAIAAQAMIGTAIGSGHGASAHRDIRRLLGWGLATGSVTGVLVFAARDVVPGVFVDDGAVLDQIGQAWWLVAILQPAAGLVFVADGILMGSKDFRFLLGSTALASLGGLLPVAVAAKVFGWGITGLWYGMAALVGIRLATSLWRLRPRGWARVVGATTPIPLLTRAGWPGGRGAR